MRLTHLRSFHGVAVTGSFTAAAELLNISQPTVTVQVRALEESYGVELFHRQRRDISLTPLGKQLYALSKKIFSLESEARELLVDSGKLQVGRLRIGAVGPFHATEMLAVFNEYYPGISISVRFGNSKYILDSLLDYKTDVAVLARFMDDPAFYSLPYRSHPLVLMINKNHKFARTKSLSIKDLEGENIILREKGSTTRKAFLDALNKFNVKCNIVMELGSREAIREAVIMGVGISVVSQAEYIPDPTLRSLELHDATMQTHAHVVCLNERRNSRLIKAFYGIVNELKIKHSDKNHIAN